MSIGEGMSWSQVIVCVRNRLGVYEKNVVSETDTSSDSDNNNSDNADAQTVSRTNCLSQFL